MLRLFNSNCCGGGVSAPAAVEIKEDLEGDPPVLASSEGTEPNGWDEYELEENEATNLLLTMRGETEWLCISEVEIHYR